MSASKVAPPTLSGLDEPSDFATTSCIPRVSNTARIGPPAMMPGPACAARRYTLPAPWRSATSAWRRACEIALAGAVPPGHIVMEGAAFAQRNADETALGGVGRLADRLRHFARLA